MILLPPPPKKKKKKREKKAKQRAAILTGRLIQTHGYRMHGRRHFGYFVKEFVYRHMVMMVRFFFGTFCQLLAISC